MCRSSSRVANARYISPVAAVAAAVSEAASAAAVPGAADRPSEAEQEESGDL